VRTAIRFLRHRVGGWQPLADAFGVKADSLGKVDLGNETVVSTPFRNRGLLRGGRILGRW
jgi:hypothetical protein